MNEFDKFEAKEGESLESVYERLSTLVNVMDRNDVRPIKVSINTKFLNSLQPEWSKYVTLTRQNKDFSDVEYDSLYDALLQFEPHVQESTAKLTAKNHDPLSLIAHSNAYSSQSHASPLYSHSPQPYYVTHPSSVVDSEEDYQKELQEDAHEDKLLTTMMLLAREITQKFSTPTNNRLRTSLNTRNQDVIHDGRVNQECWIDESNQIVQRVPRIKSNPGRANVQCYNCNARGHYARDCPKPKVCDAKYFREQMLLAMKDEAGGTLNDEENDFMLDNA
ncbi:putative RNA-directed DNA polymerase [Tanacetum coccineum]